MSLDMGREISTPLDVNQNGQMILGHQNVGESDSCVVESGTFGLFHTHPKQSTGQIVDSFSIRDVICSVKYNLPIMVAQTAHNNRVWFAIRSDDTAKVNKPENTSSGMYTKSILERI